MHLPELSLRMSCHGGFGREKRLVVIVQRKLFEDQPHVLGILLQDCPGLHHRGRAEGALEVGELDNGDLRVLRADHRVALNVEGDPVVEHWRRGVRVATRLAIICFSSFPALRSLMTMFSNCRLTPHFGSSLRHLAMVQLHPQLQFWDWSTWARNRF